MENIFLLKTEIVIFFLSLFYIMYFVYEKFIIIITNIKNIIKPDKSHIEEKIKKLQDLEIKKTKQETKVLDKLKEKEKNNIHNISLKDSKKIAEIIKRVKINKTKGYFDKAKSLIIQGLAIDKLNKDLNLELVSIYEEEKDFKKAEFIYNDLLLAYKNNFEILKKLGYNLALQGKYEESIEIYLKAYSKRKDDIEIVEFLADLTYQVKLYKKSLKFLKIYLREHPRNSEKLKMRAFCHEVLGEIKDAIFSYKKVLELQPYNNQVREKIDFLEQQV